MQKRVLSLLLALVMLFGMLPVTGFVMSAAATVGTTNDGSSSTIPGALATDTTTKGAWQGKYGSDTAVLFGYMHDASARTDTSRVLIDHTNLNLVVNGIESPYYQSISILHGGSLWSYKATDQTSALAMPDVTGAGGTPFNAYAMTGYTNATNGEAKYSWMKADGAEATTATYSYGYTNVVLNDTAEHVLTVYSNKACNYPVTFFIVNTANTTVLAQQTFEANYFANGAYVSFPVSGSFNIYVAYDGATNQFGINALFLDAPEVFEDDTGDGETGDGETGDGSSGTIPGALATDTTTKGAWQGKYGSDTAVLFGYKYDFSGVTDTGRNTAVHRNNDNLVLGSGTYFSSLGVEPGGNLWSWVGSGASVLEMPNVSGAGGTAFNAYAMNGFSQATSMPNATWMTEGSYYCELDVNLTDTAEHVLTLYSNYDKAYGNYKATNDVTIYIVDTSRTTVLAQETFTASEFSGGMYVSFAISGSCKVYVTTVGGNNAFGVSALFLDTLAAPEGLLVESASEDGTQAKVSWDGSSMINGAQVHIERKLPSDTSWTSVGTVDASVGTYTDTGLTLGTTYEYRLSAVLGSKTVISETAYTYKAVAMAASLVGTSDRTDGDWIGMVGGEGYILPFYTVYQNYSTSTDYALNGSNGTTGRYQRLSTADASLPQYLNALSEGASYIQKPSYVESITEAASQNGYEVHASVTYQETDNVYALQNPADNGTTRLLSTGRGEWQLGFDLTDEAWHYVTVYANCFNNPSQTTYQILNASKTVLTQSTVTLTKNGAGAWITFKVKGDFTLKVVKAGGNAAFLTGVFFDAVPTEAVLTTPTAVQSGTVVNVSWTNAGTEPVAVERAVSGSGAWVTLDTVANGTNTYTDTTAVGGTTYDYRVRTAGILPSETTESVILAVKEVPAELVGAVSAETIGGDWLDNVGDSGYLLPFYTVYEKYNPLVDNTTWYVYGNRYSNSNEKLNYTMYTLEDGVSLIAKPSYVTKVAEVATGNGYDISSSNFQLTDDTRAPADPRNDGATRYKSFVRTGSTMAYRFTLSDNEWHYVTVYAVNYGTAEYAATYSIREGITDAAYNSTTPAAAYSATYDEIQKGVYITFKVKGSFTLHAKWNALEGQTNGYAFFNGIFFDEIPSGAQLSGLAAEQDGRAIDLTWSYTGANLVEVQRMVSGGSEWETIATVAADANAYTDTTAAVGTTYEYRLCAVNDILPTEETSSTVSLTMAEPAYEYISSGSITGGDWIGKVGNDGYFLPFFTVAEMNGGTITSGRHEGAITTLQEGASEIKLPDDVAITAESGTSNGYSIGANTIGAAFDFRESTDVRAPQDPRTGKEGTRIRSYVRSSPHLQYTFDMPEDKAYYVTVYATAYDASTAADTTLAIQNTSGKTIASKVVTLAELRVGVYTTFKVTGDFILRVSCQSGSYVHINGVFFDEAPTWEVSDFTAEKVNIRDAKLTWTNNEEVTQVAIERKDSETNTWTRIAVTEADTTFYTDTSCEVNKTYTYRIAPTTGILVGVYSAEQSVVMPTYTQTKLVLSAQNDYTVDMGGNVIVSGTLTSNGTGLSGKTVTFTLSGYLIDEKLVAANWGTATTAEDGSFTHTLADLPAGTYTLTVYFAPDDTAELAQSKAVATITIEVPAWSGVPVLTTVSDGVAPGEYFSVSGFGLNLGTPVVKVGTSFDSAVTATIAQYDATDGYFIQAQLPASLSAGTYNVWVTNSEGTSEPILLNAARPLFISENSAWNGLTIEISGRNLLGSQYGANNATKVRLLPVSGGAAIEQEITENNPYRIAFTVTGASVGAEYYVEVTNDGTNWAPLSSGQTLTVVAAGNDPLNLGVAWADKFNWTSTYIDVTDAAYGATNNDTTDDTAAIQAAVNAAAAQTNGGVVYLPAGKYYVGQIHVPAHVVILGESKTNTFLYYNGASTNYMFGSYGTGQTEGYQGFARFTIRLADNNHQPDQYFTLGHAWNNQLLNDKSARTCSYFFLSEVDIDTDVMADGTALGTKRGMGVVPIVAEHFLMQDCHFVGYRAILASGYIRGYATMKNCYMEFANGIPQINAEYTFIEDTNVYMHYETGADSHGITVRDNTHVEDCYVFGAGGGNKNNDGEAILAEATDFYDYGKVVRVDGKKITLDGQQTKLELQVRWGKVVVFITDGTGIGQYRFVDMEESGFTFDTSINKWVINDPTVLYVTEEWDVAPDATSRYTLVPLIENVTFHNNTIEDCVKGLWFYGNVVDGVIAGNNSINAEGIFAYSSHVKGTSRHTVSYRTAIRDNDLYGIARQSNRTGIYVHAQRSGVAGEYVAVSVYGLDIKNNRIYGDPNTDPVSMNETPRHSGIVISACEISSDGGCITELGQGDITNTLVQGNLLKNLREGVLVTNCTYGTLLDNNYYGDVTTKVSQLKTAANNGDFHLLKTVTEATTQPACDGDHSVLVWDTTTSTGTCVWCGETQTGTVLAASVENFSVTLGDSIDLDFFLDLSADVLADQNAYVKVTLPDMNGTTYTVKVSELTKKDSLVVVQCVTAAKEMTGIVRLQVFSGDWNSPSIERTVQDYAKKLMEIAADTEHEQNAQCVAALPAVKAMLNYGAAAQTHFGYNTGDLANSILAEEDRVYDELDDLDLTSWNALTVDDSTDVDFVGATLMLEGKTGLRLYFNIANPDAYTFTGGSWVDKAGNGYTGYVEVEDIVAKALGDTFTVTVKSGDDVVATVNHSPMKYGYNVQVGEYAETLDNLVAAIYNYYNEAKNYFSNN